MRGELHHSCVKAGRKIVFVGNFRFGEVNEILEALAVPDSTKSIYAHLILGVDVLDKEFELIDEKTSVCEGHNVVVDNGHVLDIPGDAVPSRNRYLMLSYEHTIIDVLARDVVVFNPAHVDFLAWLH
jgi:hypothetical protein